jgi:hypothetical protein
VRPRLVSPEPILHEIEDHLLVLAGFHVDKVDNDQATNVAEP